MISVDRLDEQTFEVEVKEGASASRHTVTVDEDYLQKLTDGQMEAEQLIRRSFEFLLAREPKESILARFDLRDIKRYFPSYEEQIAS